jgi:D-tyrosyl-tRNA(Tyr) deacylase
MIVVLQRVKSASVSIRGEVVGEIGRGLMLLVGIAEDDKEEDVEFVADKCAHLRIFPDEQGKMNRSLLDVHGAVLAISQFTLLGDTRKGRRPSFIEAASPEKGNKLYQYFIKCLGMHKINVETGVFGAMMEVSLINDGPVTFVVKSKKDR